MSFNQKTREHDYKISFSETKDEAFVYLRSGYEQFLAEVSKMYNLIIYSKGTKEYNEILLKIVDPSNLYFKNKIYHDDNCHLYIDNKEEHSELIRDINLFTNISLKDKILINSNCDLSEVFTPDNSKKFLNYSFNYRQIYSRY